MKFIIKNYYLKKLISIRKNPYDRDPDIIMYKILKLRLKVIIHGARH